MPPRATAAIDKLSEDILVEIFDAYRQLYESKTRYENIWNSRNGWFKLTHVCQTWRRLVHLSPSRLHVHLLFTPHRSSKAIMLKDLPPFPILIDYKFAKWTKRELGLALAAIGHHGCVRGISLRGRPFTNSDNIFQALNRPFPDLESLQILSDYGRHNFVMLPATFLLGSAPCLRRLKLQNVDSRCLSPLLSIMTGLAELSLSIRIPLDTLPEESLIANLQRMSCLRRLELLLQSHPSIISDIPRPQSPTRTGDIVPLPNLMQLVFVGQHIYLEALMAVLAAPSLQNLGVGILDTTDTLSIPHLCRFICDTDNQFCRAHLEFLDTRLGIIAETRSIHTKPFRIAITGPISLEEIGNKLSGPLATVEKLGIRWNVIGERQGPHGLQWRRFFEHTRQLKFLSVPWQVALDVAHSFQQDGQGLYMELLPDLDIIYMDMKQWYPGRPPPGSNSQDHAIIPDAFEPLIAARTKAGHPITLSSLT